MMNKALVPLPVVLTFGVNDPCGSAGIHADIETLGAMGCHCAPIITGITSQDTAKLYQNIPCPSQMVMEQARKVLEDMSVVAIKIGPLSSTSNIRALHAILKNYPNLPIICDLAFSSMNTAQIPMQEIQEALAALILPHVKICILDPQEAKAMAPEADSLDACAQHIMGQGANYVLITRGQYKNSRLINNFYGNYRHIENFSFEKLNADFKGAGTTLSAAIAGLVAQGLDIYSAVFKALQFTTECLKNGYRLGMGRHVPNRLFWARGTTYDYDVATTEQKEKQFG